MNIMAGEIICKISLETIVKTKSLDITESATPCRYRLLSCNDFIEHKQVTVLEFDDFPQVPYTALSYVWKGNTLDADCADPVFNVPVPEGQEPGDDIGVEVLRETCVASTARGINHLWIDRLCVMQMSKEDKKWQIPRMHDIYRRCQICIVAPGGLQRLVRLDEVTQWIHRGWTLQEAVAPPAVFVLFSWRSGSRRAHAGDTQGNIDEVTPARSATTPLSLIIDACTAGMLSIENGEKRLMLEVKLFSSHPADRSYRDFPFWNVTRRILSPNVGALARIMSPDLDRDMKDYSIWQSALMRTSSRPVDMVFSIMGLFGVTLDTSQFGKNDRVQATIALAQAIMEKGGQATWLAAAFRVQPSRQISTFPIFPRTSVSGKAYVKVSDEKGMQEVSLLIENDYPVADALVPLPKGSMDQDGYLKFSSKAIPIRPHLSDPAETSPDSARPTYFQAVNQSWWEVEEDNIVNMQGETFAVLIGFFVGYYPGSTPAVNDNTIRAAVIKKHAVDRFHVQTYLGLSHKARAWVRTWPERIFCVGGPEVDAVEDLGEELPVISNPKEQYLNNPQSSQPSGVVPLEDMLSRRARWAMSQKVLEQHVKPR
ncbi:uncharacterized protein F4812DRAFT_97671 [Daldinia caldariorum]|uniref:uncharacterized protein n=1 Tax=Daldinia caldariorum TaxID=326644 RepID=UPI002008E064|nr:uncharacterized protein F4812DRAFT_97671 [Daldinia caldariorum]KAI1466118.1 hypothetical protein F4812DRAFT_97671 [Daldinia caldariorum]